MLEDPFGRRITYLRVSVTDRCNLRCAYCMPPDGVILKSHQEVMRYEEIAQVVRVAAENGVSEVRLTGGEPLVRPGLQSLVQMLAQIPGIEDLSLTTNAALLDKMAQPLAEAGLGRVNISLDTLDAQKYQRITRGGVFERTWRGIEAAEANDLTPIKINTVVMRGVNDDELLDLARLTLDHPWHVRFIEMMPINNCLPWGGDFPTKEQMSMQVPEMMERLAPLGLQPVDNSIGSGPARLYQTHGAQGKIGFISAVSAHFCQQCNRLRLTADGKLRVCLLNNIEVSLLAALQAGEAILPYIQRAVDLKPMGHQLAGQDYTSSRSMREIGG